MFSSNETAQSPTKRKPEGRRGFHRDLLWPNAEAPCVAVGFAM